MASGTLLTGQDMKEFLSRYGGLIHQECVSLVGEGKEARELEDRVIASVQAKYEYTPLPENCETMLIAQCCILSSWMEPRVENMTPGAGSGTPAWPPAESPEAGEAPRTEEGVEPPEMEKIHVTAVIDPEKTELWLPGNMKPDQVRIYSDPEDDSETSERSGAHSVVNTFLMIAFLGSVAFFLWNTGILRWLKRMVEGLFVYG